MTLRLRCCRSAALGSLREDEIACRSLGINTTKTKLTARLGAMFGGFAGSFFAVRQGFIAVELRVHGKRHILAIVVLGGAARRSASPPPPSPSSAARNCCRTRFSRARVRADFDPTQYRMLLVGLAMVVMMNWRPRGFAAHREPSIALERQMPSAKGSVREGRG